MDRAKYILEKISAAKTAPFQKVLKSMIKFERDLFGKNNYQNRLLKIKNKKDFSNPQTIKNIRGNMSQEDFAKQIGITTKTVSRWETGVSKPRKYMLNKIENVKHKQPFDVNSVKKLRGTQTQKEFAKKLGISTRTVMRWELGKSKPKGVLLETLRKLSNG
jgi:DNA-binding transcriptional regulator YiaG